MKKVLASLMLIGLIGCSLTPEMLIGLIGCSSTPENNENSNGGGLAVV